jgi:hypothetical protein
LKYAIGSLDKKITCRQTDANDPFGGYNYGLMAFTDSDWATSVEVLWIRDAAMDVTSSCLLEAVLRIEARQETHSNSRVPSQEML